MSLKNVSGDAWNILINKAEMETRGKIKMAPKGQGVVAYGVEHRRLTDVSGLGLAKQAKRLTHPDPPKKEDELAVHVEMWQDSAEAGGTRRGDQVGASLQDQRLKDVDDRQGHGLF